MISTPRVNCFSRSLKYAIKYLRTGMQYGFIQFEDRILQALINDFSCEEERLNRDAEVWYKVLY